MKVWIDQDLCTGDGLCEEIAPDVFVGLDDGLFYVKEGDNVKVGQVLCIIESMKIMNEIESEHNGIIKEIIVNNSDPVEFNQPIFIIEPTYTLFSVLKQA